MAHVHHYAHKMMKVWRRKNEERMRNMVEGVSLEGGEWYNALNE